MLFEGDFIDFTSLSKVFKYKYLHMNKHTQFVAFYILRYQIIVALVALNTMIEIENTSIDHTWILQRKQVCKFQDTSWVT